MGFQLTVIVFFIDFLFKIIDWISGPGESYLSMSNKIGDSVKSCEFHKRAHDDFETTAGVSDVIHEIVVLTQLVLLDKHNI